jgi:SAM-dependent methyltransferase
MRANTSRAGALVFGKLVEDYTIGRLPVTADEIAAIRSRISDGDPREPRRVMEVGAGTGQLTKALVGFSTRLIALEPDKRFRDVLRAELSSSVEDGSVQVVGARFEDALTVVPEGSVDEIWSCDAFHWIDPDAGYGVASRLTTKTGSLVLIWRFIVACDARLRERLNTIFRDASPDLVRDEDFDKNIEDICAQGRGEMRASGAFLPTHFEWMSRTLHMSAERFASLQLSFGNIAALSAEDKEELRREIIDVVGPAGLDVRQRTYYTIGRKLSEQA